MSRDSSRDRTWLIPHAPADRPKQQPVSLEDLWPESRRSREVPAVIDVAPTHVLPVQPKPLTQPIARPQPRPPRRRQLLALLAKPFELPFLMLRSADWVVHSLLHLVVALLFSDRETPAPKRANPQPYFPPAWPPLEPLPPLEPWRPAEPYERFREPSAFGDSRYLAGSRLSDYERLRQHASQ